MTTRLFNCSHGLIRNMAIIGAACAALGGFAGAASAGNDRGHNDGGRVWTHGTVGISIQIGGRDRYRTEHCRPAPARRDCGPSFAEREFERGLERGYKAGYANGYRDGLKANCFNDHSDRCMDDFTRHFAEGFHQGFHAIYADGYAAGKRDRHCAPRPVCR